MQKQMHQILMNLLTLTFLFINIHSDPTVDHLKNGTYHGIESGLQPQVIYDDFSQHVLRRSTTGYPHQMQHHLPQAAESNSDDSTVVYQNMRGIGVKVKNVNAKLTSGKKTNSGNRKSDDKLNESESSYSPVQPVYLPMDALPGLDLEIDAMGLGGIPPGVRIETRNGRPVVEILPNLDLMHSMTNEDVHDKKSGGKRADFTIDDEKMDKNDQPGEQRVRKKSRKRKAKNGKRSPGAKAATAKIRQIHEKEDDEDESPEENVPEPHDDVAYNDVTTKSPANRRPIPNPESIRNPQSFNPFPPDNSSARLSPESYFRKLTADIKYRPNSRKMSDIDQDAVTRNPTAGEVVARSDEGGEGDIVNPVNQAYFPKDLADPRLSHSARRIPKSIWNYEEEDKWVRRYPTCSGQLQSPINLTPKLIHEEPGLSLDFTNRYNTKLPKTKLINTGLTLELQFDGNDARPGLTGSGVYDDMYLFEKMHFHWGSKNTIGSEHSIFGQKFPVEMHLVHYNDKYKSVEEAFDKPDGLCVVAVFFQVSNTDNPRFNKLLQQIPNVECGGQVASLNDQISLSNFLPSNRKEFYRYQGSLTTPPCSESVTWIILKHGLLISKSQLKKIRELKQHNCVTPITNNWRNLQSAHGRRVEKAVQVSTTSGTSTISALAPAHGAQPPIAHFVIPGLLDFSMRLM